MNRCAFLYANDLFFFGVRLRFKSIARCRRSSGLRLYRKVLLQKCLRPLQKQEGNQTWHLVVIGPIAYINETIYSILLQHDAFIGKKKIIEMKAEMFRMGKDKKQA